MPFNDPAAKSVDSVSCRVGLGIVKICGGTGGWPGTGGGVGPPFGFCAVLPARSIDRTLKWYDVLVRSPVSRTLCAVTKSASDTVSVCAGGNAGSVE